MTKDAESPCTKCSGDFRACSNLQDLGLKHKLFTPDFLWKAGIFVAGLFMIAAIFARLCLTLPWGNVITIIGIGVAILGWLFTSAVTLHNRIKQHSFDLIRLTRFDDTYIDLFDEAIKLWKQLSQDDQGVISKDTWESAMLNGEPGVRSTLRLLNFYELVSYAVYCNDASNSIIREYYESIFESNYNRTKELISLLRNPTDRMRNELKRQKDKKAFLYFECITSNWLKETEREKRLNRYRTGC